MHLLPFASCYLQGRLPVGALGAVQAGLHTCPYNVRKNIQGEEERQVSPGGPPGRPAPPAAPGALSRGGGGPKFLFGGSRMRLSATDRTRTTLLWMAALMQ